MQIQTDPEKTMLLRCWRRRRAKRIFALECVHKFLVYVYVCVCVGVCLLLAIIYFKYTHTHTSSHMHTNS